MAKLKLLLATFDAQLTELKIKPKYDRTKVTYKLKIYDEALQQTVTKTVCFEGVTAIEFRMNYFDNPIGAEVCGFYEIESRDEKLDMLERNFLFRREGFLLSGDYEYDPDEENDILNYRESIDSVCDEIDTYHLYQQQTTGGIYLILAKQWYVK